MNFQTDYLKLKLKYCRYFTITGGISYFPIVIFFRLGLIMWNRWIKLSNKEFLAVTCNCALISESEGHLRIAKSRFERENSTIFNLLQSIQGLPILSLKEALFTADFDYNTFIS